MKNSHPPLPDQTYTRLRAEGERAQVPTTALAREAIDWSPVATAAGRKGANR